MEMFCFRVLRDFVVQRCRLDAFFSFLPWRTARCVSTRAICLLARTPPAGRKPLEIGREG
ncbi:MAG: hypothetical protein C5B57_00470 [Blastocatellia bacterium]|nr:MAG: hypothetical protein C5B57_00470 [Blastocatellia bacterium]